MKIAHITTLHPRRDIRIFLKECLSLRHAGYDVSLIVADGKQDEVTSGVSILNCCKTIQSRLLRLWLSYFIVILKALKARSQLYHIHDPELLPLGTLLTLCMKKVIYDAHEDLPRQILSKQYIPSTLRKFVAFVLEVVENFFCKYYDCIVAATPHIADRFSTTNIPTVCINNYPLLSEFQQPISIPMHCREFCYVGGLTRIRGIEQIIDAANYIDAKIVLAGEFESRHFEDAAAQRPGWRNIRFVGQLSREAVRDLFAQCFAGLVLFLPEPNHMSAQPNKLFEYMSAGLPVIASNFPLWREIVEGNNCGICVDPTNPEMISNAINEIMANPDRAREMGRNGRKAIESKYNWESEKQKLINLYSNLLSDTREYSSN